MTYFIAAYDKNKMVVSKTETTSQHIASVVSFEYAKQGYRVKFWTED